MARFERTNYNLPNMLLATCHKCNARNTFLPNEMLEAVHLGNIDKIKAYIDLDKDVNGQYKEETLLSRACAEGQVEIVKFLLQCPEIHTNTSCRGETPLMRANQNGHTECFALLVDSSAQCDVQFDHCWKGIGKFLKNQPEIKLRSALRILTGATQKSQWDVIDLLLQSNHHFLAEIMCPLIMKAASQDRWDIVYQALKREFYGKDGLIQEMFAIVVNERRWQRVEELIHLMNGGVKIEIPLVGMALAGKSEEIQKMIAENEYDAQTLNGTLLVVAAGGTSQPVVEFLMTIKNTYTKESFSDALSLSALGNFAVMFLCLLSNPEASYGLSVLNKVMKIFTHQSQYQYQFQNFEFLKKVLSEYIEKL